MKKEILIPSMTAVDDGLQNFLLLVLKALIYTKQALQRRKCNFSKKVSFICQTFEKLYYCQITIFSNSLKNVYVIKILSILTLLLVRNNTLQ